MLAEYKPIPGNDTIQWAMCSSAKRLRVLHLNAGNLYGGVETLLTTLAEYRSLCPDMEPHFAACYEGRWTQELLAAGVPVHMLGGARLGQPWTVWRARRRLRELLDRVRFDVAICHMPWSLAVFGPAVRAAGCPLGFWAHSFHTGRTWLELIARQTNPDLAIANSRFTEAGLTHMFPRAARGVVYPPVALAALPQSDQQRSRLRAQQGIGEDTVVIIQVSRMEACKGHFLHLEALARLRQLHTPWVCWIAGGAQKPDEAEYMNRLRRRLDELDLTGRVEFLGQRADIKELLAAADIFCQPNQTPDSFGISFVEALWASRPVVTTALGGATEILEESCGFLVDRDPAQIAVALQQLIENRELRARLGFAGTLRARALSDPETQMKVLSALLRRCTEGETPIQ
jgi:glycosyltransferase involved in cell wall biosynthesis